MGTSFVYRLARIVVRVTLGVYFRKLELAGAENIPVTGPVILAANHPQSITDALILSVTTRRMVYYLAHGGLFVNPVKAWFLRRCGVIPVYRPSDDPAAADKNVDMFSACYEVLEKGRVIGIFPEGNSAEERRLQKLKTGAARIALNVEDRNGWRLGLVIVPMGLNFESRARFRSRVLISIGTPIEISSFRTVHDQDPVEAVNRVTDEIAGAIRRRIMNVDRGEMESFVRDVERVYRTEVMESRSDDSVTRAAVSNEIPLAIEYFLRRDPARVWQIKESLRDYLRKLERFRISDETLRQDDRSVIGAATRFTLLGLLGLPFAFCGVLANYVPYKLTGLFAKAMAHDATKIHFFQISLGTIFFVVAYAVMFLIADAIFGRGGAIVLVASMIPLGLFARGYEARMNQRRDMLRLSVLRVNHDFYVRRLRHERAGLITALDAAVDEYERFGRQP